MPPPTNHQNIFTPRPDRNIGDWIIYSFGMDGGFLNFRASSYFQKGIITVFIVLVLFKDPRVLKSVYPVNGIT